MEELTHVMVQCSTSFIDPWDSILNSFTMKLFYEIWDKCPDIFVGKKRYYEENHPQRLFISQGETSGTAQYSYEEDPYPHDRFRVRIFFGQFIFMEKIATSIFFPFTKSEKGGMGT